MIDSKGRQYDGWAIAGRTREHGVLASSVRTTRSKCIRDELSSWNLGITWRKLKRTWGLRCVKVRVMEID